MPLHSALPDSLAHPDFPDLSFTGGCEVDLRRAVIRYRSAGERGIPGGRSEDLGVGVVLDAPAGGVTRILDLGSGQVRESALELPLVVFGWIFSGPHRELLQWVARTRGGGSPRPGGPRGPGSGAVAAAGASAPGAAVPGPRTAGNGAGADEVAAPRAEGSSLPRGVLGGLLSRLGFGPTTRPVFLRVGFRDVALDLDPHEGTAVRLALAGGGVCRVHLDYDRAVLVCRTGRSAPDKALAAVLPDAFPNRSLFRVTSGAGQGTAEFHVHLPDLLSVAEVRDELRRIRRGLLHLMARFDGVRYEAVSESLAGFGERDLLGRVADSGFPGGARARERIRVPRSSHRSRRVH
jgi:hypothetical protein